MKIVIFRRPDQKWYFHIKARNGRIVAQSEGYQSKRNLYSTVYKLAEAQFIVETEKQLPLNWRRPWRIVAGFPLR